MTAFILDENTVACLHQALGIDAIVNSIKQLTAHMHQDKKEETDDDFRSTKRIKLDHAEAENEDDESDVEVSIKAGNLKNHLDFWIMLTSVVNILETVQGYKIEFSTMPINTILG